MPVGDCQREFATDAADDGFELSPQNFPWLCQQGHLVLFESAPEVAATLEQIYVALGGDLEILATARSTPLRGDFVHVPTGTLIEIDEKQHFTTARLASLDLYDEASELGFSLKQYKALCREHRAAADRYRATKAARGFGANGRTSQRAYYDALRDLATPAMDHLPLIRIDASHGDGRAAYRAHRDRLHARLT